MTASQPSAEKIRRRAYQLYRDRGSRPGYAIDDWLQAERELQILAAAASPDAEPAPGDQDAIDERAAS